MKTSLHNVYSYIRCAPHSGIWSYVQCMYNKCYSIPNASADQGMSDLYTEYEASKPLTIYLFPISKDLFICQTPPIIIFTSMACSYVC